MGGRKRATDVIMQFEAMDERNMNLILWSVHDRNRILPNLLACSVHFSRSAGRDSCAANKIIDVMRGTRAQNQSVFGDSQRFQMPITRRQKSKSESWLELS